MKNLMNTIDTKIYTGVIRAKQALKNNDGMEVIQFLAVALISVAVAGLLYTTMKGKVDEFITGLGTKLVGLFAD